MKRIIKWLRRDTQQQSAVKEAGPAPVRIRSEEEGEHSDESSFDCSWADQADSSIFDTGSLVLEKTDAGRPAKNQSPDTTSSVQALTDNGVDPYNTGRFDTENK